MTGNRVFVDFGDDGVLAGSGLPAGTLRRISKARNVHPSHWSVITVLIFSLIRSE
jgi:hypothetical protein